MAALTKYADSYAGLASPRQTSGQTVLALLSMMQQAQQHQAALKQRDDEFKQSLAATQQQQGIQDEFQRGRLLSENIDRQNRVNEFNAQLEATKGKIGTAERNTLLKNAVDMAASGVEVDTSGFTPQEKALLDPIITQARAQHEQQYGLAKGAADTLNRNLKTQSQTKELQTTIDKFPLYKKLWYKNPVNVLATTPDEVTQLDALNVTRPQFEAEAAKVNADPSLKGLTVWDGRAGKYVPAIPPPTKSRSAPKLNAPVVGPTPVDPNQTPGWTANPQFQDAGSFNVPRTVPATGAPVSGPPIGGVMPKIIRNGNNLFQLMPDGSYQFFQRTEGVPSGMASGGMVHGRGTPTSDNITAKVSPGEYVLPAEAMEIPGAKAACDHMRDTALKIRASRNSPLRMAKGGMIPGLPGMGGGGGFNPMSMFMPMMGGGGGNGGGFNPLSMFLPFMGGGGGMPGGGDSGGVNMMMPWMALKQPFKFARGGMVPRYAAGGLVDNDFGSLQYNPDGTIGAFNQPNSFYAQNYGAPVNAAAAGGGMNWMSLLMGMLQARKGGAGQKPNPIYNWENVA